MVLNKSGSVDDALSIYNETNQLLSGFHLQCYISMEQSIFGKSDFLQTSVCTFKKIYSYVNIIIYMIYTYIFI